MKKLIGMVDTLPEHPHSIFLKQKPNIWMFVACDEDGNVLEEPYNYQEFLDGNNLNTLCEEYQQAQERIIFEGFVKCNRNSNVSCVYNKDLDLHLYTEFKFVKTIEDLVKYNLTLRK